MALKRKRHYGGVAFCVSRTVLLRSAFRSITSSSRGAGRSSEVERSLVVRWVVGSILHGVDPLSYFSFQPVLHDWCNKCRGMCYPVISLSLLLLLCGSGVIGPDDAVAMSSANGMVGTGFASRYRLQPRAGF